MEDCSDDDFVSGESGSEVVEKEAGVEGSETEEEQEEFEMGEEDEEGDEEEESDFGGSDKDHSPPPKKSKKSKENTAPKATKAKASTTKKAANEPKKAAPKKKAVTIETVSESVGVDLVLDYMLQQNRPYSQQNVFDNLHKRVRKPMVQKILDKLTDQGKLQKKEFGKVKIYLANQSNFECASSDEIKSMDVTIQEKKAKVENLEGEIAALKRELAQITSQPNDDQIVKETKDLGDELESSMAKLTILRSSHALVSEKDFNELNSGLEKYGKEWRRRKRAFKGMLDVILEASDKNAAQLMEELGCERDEDLGINIDLVYPAK